MTIGAKLDENGGFGGGFDLLRVFLAICVVAFHSYWIVNVAPLVGLTRPGWLIGYALVPAFFVLSGFLVAGSAQRLHVGDFLINRGLRIVPALLFVSLMSAIAIGSLCTRLPLQTYFLSPQTWEYMGNALGLISYQLPGVFKGQPNDVVNASLWSIPWELACYGLTAIISIIGAMKYPKIVLSGVLIFIAAGVVTQGLGLASGRSVISTMLNHFFIGRAAKLPLFFLLGISAYLFRYKLPYSWVLFIVSGVLFVGVDAFAPTRWLDTPILGLLSCVPIAYLIIFIGVTNVAPLPIFHRGDYSYGIYLYGYPVQQALKVAFPRIGNPWAMTTIALPFIVLVAALSWHFVEEPVLRFRKRLSFSAPVRLATEHDGTISSQI